MKIGLDLDGTIYNTLDAIFDLDQQTRREFGYEPLSIEEYRRCFQTENWHKLCLDLGIRKEDLLPYREKLAEKIKTREPPHLVPGGKEAVEKIERELGLDNLSIVTNNRNPAELKRRFGRDGLSHLLGKVIAPYEGKTDALADIAGEDPDTDFVYVGDLVSDGRACQQARAMGAENIIFCAITHKYAMNLPEALHAFVDQHEFAVSIGSLNELELVWKDKTT